MSKKSLRADKRTTVSLDNVVWQWAVESMRKRGYNSNFSAYVAGLIRRDKEREDDRQLALAKAASDSAAPATPAPEVPKITDAELEAQRAIVRKLKAERPHRKPVR